MMYSNKSVIVPMSCMMKIILIVLIRDEGIVCPSFLYKVVFHAQFFPTTTTPI